MSLNRLNLYTGYNSEYKNIDYENNQNASYSKKDIDVKYTWLNVDLTMVKMEILDLDIKRKYDKILSKNYLLFFPKNQNTNSDKYFKLSDEGYRLTLSLINHNNFSHIIDDTMIEIDNIDNGLTIINSSGIFTKSYIEYYIDIYQLNGTIIEIIKLPGFSELINIIGKKSECEMLANKFNLDLDKVFNGDIYDLYKKYGIDITTNININFNNQYILSKIKEQLNSE
jgi:hypothetical protein